MKKQKMFLGKFPIIRSTGHETERRVWISDANGKYEANVSLIYFTNQLDINSAIAHEGIDEHLVPRIALIRDLYNEIIENLKKEKATDNENWIDLALTKKVLPPKFYLSLDQQSTLKTVKEVDPIELREIYTNLVSRICQDYPIKTLKTIEYWLHEERIMLPVTEGYTIEFTKPTGHIQTFEIHANNKVDYTRLEEFSKYLGKTIDETLGEKIKIYPDKYTNCHFQISLDISIPQRLSGKSLDRLLLNA